jgi:hypothetical protein
LRHRIILNFEGQAEGIDTDDLIDSLIERHEAERGARAAAA